jgi:hypothetical protein
MVKGVAAWKEPETSNALNSSMNKAYVTSMIMIEGINIFNVIAILVNKI